MMKEFTLEGEIGWDVGTREVKGILEEAAGGDILIRFASPGGSVFTGFKIFNLIKNYAGSVDFHLIGEAASMGSYIPLAGRRITAEANVVYMIHNARTWTGGDQNQLRKTADIVEGLSNLMKNEYIKRTGLSMSKVTEMMDAETYLFGQEAVDAGFVDAITGESNPDPAVKGNHLALAKEAFEACMQKVKTERTDDYEKAAAILATATVNAGTVDEPSVTGEIKKEKKTMTDAELRAQYPELCAALIKEGAMEERDRVCAFLVAGEASGNMGVAVKAINEGSKMTATLSTTFMMAAVAKRDVSNRESDDTAASDALDGINGSEDQAKDKTAGTNLLKAAAKLCGVDVEVK